jgi:fucose 4-O-acetylase-like acetyltransferase
MFMLGQGWTRGAWGRLVWLIPLALLTPALNVEFAGGPLFVSHSAVSLNSNLFGAPPLFAVSAVAGCAMLWRIVCLTPDAARPKLWAAAWGRRAINVLIVHGLVTWAARTWFGQGVELSSPAALVSWTLACVALTVLHEPLRRALQPVLNRLHEIASWMAEAGTTSMRAAGERRSDQLSVAGGLACAPPVQSTN